MLLTNHPNLDLEDLSRISSSQFSLFWGLWAASWAWSKICVECKYFNSNLCQMQWHVSIISSWILSVAILHSWHEHLTQMFWSTCSQARARTLPHVLAWLGARVPQKVWPLFSLSYWEYWKKQRPTLSYFQQSSPVVGVNIAWQQSSPEVWGEGFWTLVTHTGTVKMAWQQCTYQGLRIYGLYPIVSQVDRMSKEKLERLTAGSCCGPIQLPAFGRQGHVALVD